jgi:hypothetical protein
MELLVTLRRVVVPLILFSHESMEFPEAMFFGSVTSADGTGLQNVTKNS